MSARLLLGVEGFDSLPAPDLERLGAGGRERRFEPGDLLLRAGEAGDSLFVLGEGRVRVSVRDEAGSLRSTAHVERGGIVGEMALLTGEPRTADVVAETPVEALELRRRDVEPLLHEHPRLARFLTAILARRLERHGGISRVGRLRILRPLGQGATSRVYEALDAGLERVVAIKFLDHSMAFDARWRERFLDEARTIAALSHPNIVRIFDIGEAYATHYIVMERLPGEDLAGLLRRRKRLEPREASGILSQLAQGLRHAHDEGIVHRDVKPANCSVDGHGPAKLMDFGIARRIERGEPGLRAAMVEGTPLYLAPEAAVGDPVDGRADVYSLGVMAFEMLTGTLPFVSGSVRDILEMHVGRPPPDIAAMQPTLPPGLVGFVRGALRKEPEERLADWDEILDLLAAPTPPPSDEGERLPNREVVGLRFPPDAASRVRDEVDHLLARVAGIAGAEPSHGRVQDAVPPLEAWVEAASARAEKLVGADTEDDLDA